MKPRPRAGAPPDPASFWGAKAVAARIRAAQLDAPGEMLAAIPGPAPSDSFFAINRVEPPMTLAGVDAKTLPSSRQIVREELWKILGLPDWRLIGLTDPRPRGA